MATMVMVALKKKCLWCNEPFEVDASIPRELERKYCSPKCGARFRRKARKKKKRKESIYIVKNCLHCGQKFTITKAAYKEQTYCSARCRKEFRKLVSEQRLENRESILLRDGYTCRKCGSRDTLTVHHIIPTSEGGTWDADNVITLCQPCHDKEHGIVRKKSNNTNLA